MFIIFLSALSDSERDLVNQIFKEYNMKLYHISFSILHSQQDAEDALAQAFLKIIDHIDRIKKIPRHEMLPFCVMIVKNTSIDIHRKNSKTVSMESIAEIQEFSADTTEEVFFRNHDRELLLKLIKKLSSEDRYLLELRLGEGMSYKEIGAIMNITEITARKRLQRALEKLQKLYLEEGDLNA
ncbi:RNA polymerase sigma factor [Syntrophobotulus glycolicus]|uniref:RNA polymerase sigma factor n=1 Tax=Syntrophobotulus glycolicus TaxID=51197 RepID=UPI000693EAB4|nr:sigma-70 family RNA polymerase sigma factor [Syntrophobotulus glycolicus]